jgi:hypothetical protein
MTRRPTAPSAQAATAQANQAADALMAWLETQPRGGRGRLPSDPASPPDPAAMALARAEPRQAEAASTIRPRPATAPMPLGSTDAAGHPWGAGEPADAASAVPAPDTDDDPHQAPLRLAHTDWLYHRLQVTGPLLELTAFRAVAAGAGTIPWHLDLDRIADDLFHVLVAPPARAGALAPPMRGLSLAGSRILADQICAAVARRHALAAARVGHSRACPFDLHALIPVPEPVLRWGPDDPAALTWLWTHWGTTQSLRHVEEVATDPATRTQRQPGEQPGPSPFGQPIGRRGRR